MLGQKHHKKRKSRLPMKLIYETRKTGILLLSGMAILALLISRGRFSAPEGPRFPPLVMSGGDPYIRALMRTISASESNTPDPYRTLYGGGYFHDLSRHPDRCLPIVAGPNVGKCSTAAGRYQFLDSTWEEKAGRYHTGDSTRSYSFTPEYQDRVTYAWLKDTGAWNHDLGALLRQGQIERVLQILSPTWTSLGYGIEDNSMTPSLPALYRRFLQEELESDRAEYGEYRTKGS